MLSEKSKKRLKARKVLKHSNPTQFLDRVKKQGKKAIEDLLFLADNLEEKDLDDIFTEKEVGLLIRKILKPRTKRTIMITESIAWEIRDKLLLELPIDIVNNLASDISKTHTYAKMLSQYADKPMLKQTTKLKK